MARPSDQPTTRPLTAQRHDTNHPATLAIDRVPANQNAPPHALEAILTGLQSGGQFPRTIPQRDMDSDDEDWPRSGKRQKIQLVPQGFTFGSTANINQVLQIYPGKGTSSPSLACKELLGPFILAQFIQAGNNLPTFLQDFKHWRKTFNGLPAQAEMEAHTLGRIIHMEMVKHDSPARPSETVRPWRSRCAVFLPSSTSRRPSIQASSRSGHPPGSLCTSYTSLYRWDLSCAII